MILLVNAFNVIFADVPPIENNIITFVCDG